MNINFRYPRILVGIVNAFILVTAGQLMAQVPAPPSIGSITPQAAAPGSTVDVIIRGGNLAAPTELWTSFPATIALSPDVANNGTNAAEVVYRLTLPPEAPVGVHAMRIATAGGISALKLFIIDDLPSVASVANNTAATAAQTLTIPCAVDGTIGGLTGQYFKFTVAAGQQVAFEVLGKRFGSALDPMLRLLDANGREILYNDDAIGLHGDSRFTYTFANAGDYMVEVRDIRFQGGGNFQYRLRIGDFPAVNVPVPLGIKRGTTGTVLFAGEHIENVGPVMLNVPDDPLMTALNVGAKRQGGVSSGFATINVCSENDTLEAEPNNAPEQSNRVELGAHLNGRFETPGDVDRFIFTAKKDQQFVFAGETRRFGSPTDLYMRLFNAAGGQVAVAEDVGVAEGSINYKFPEDGDYTLVVEDLHRRGGSAYGYRVRVNPYQAGFLLEATADNLNVPAGGTAMITVNATRVDYNGPIQIAAVDLPEGYTSNPTVIGNGLLTTVLTVNAPAEAVGGKMKPIRIIGTAKIGEIEVQSRASNAPAIKAANNNMPFVPAAVENVIAASAAAKPAFTLKAEPAEVIFGQDLSATVKIIVTRGEGVTEAVVLALTPPPMGGVPAGLTPTVAPIAKDTNEIVVTFAANNQVPLGDYTVVLVGTHTKDNVNITQPIPGITLKVQAPYQLAIDPADAKVVRGGQVAVKVNVVRNPAYAGVINLTFQNLPTGVTAPAAAIAEGQNTVEVVLSAAQDAAVGAIANLTVTGEGMNGAAKLTAVSGPSKLTVE
ncbi:MAG: hypothetical protein ACKVT0_22530 [Planctomycetaceae bacterium]